jgi:hypothetical protein
MIAVRVMLLLAIVMHAAAVGAQTDSLEVLAESLAEDGADPEGAADLAETSASRMTYDASARFVTGHRNDFSTRARVAGFAAGWRKSGFFRTGFVEYRGPGFVRRLHAGRLRARLADQVVLGRGLGSYPLGYSRSAAGRFTWSPSLSRLAGAHALAADLVVRQVSVQIVAPVAVDHGVTVIWGAAAFQLPAARVGVAAGVRRNGGEGSVVSVHSIHRSGDLTWSSEYVTDGRSFGSIRVVSERGWTVSLFHAPRITTGDGPLTEFLERGGSERGGAVEWRGVMAGRLLLTRKRTVDSRSGEPSDQLRRQIWISTRRRGGKRWRWESLIYHSSTVDEAPPRWNALQQTVIDQGYRTRLRLRLTFEEGAFAHRLRADYFPGATRGFLLAIAGNWRSERFRFDWALAGYGLENRRGFIARPGPGPFESFSSVYGRGSDVAVRARIRITRRLTCTVYYGEPYEKPSRFYVGLSLGE